MINADLLKCIALVSMTLDHMAYNGLLPPWVQFTFGRLAFPIFAVLMTYHLQQKQLFKKYAIRLSFWGVVCWYACPWMPQLNIFFTLLWPVLALWGLQKLQQVKSPTFIHNLLLEILFVAGAFAGMVSQYDVFGFIYLCLLYYWWKKPNIGYAICLVIFCILGNLSSKSGLCLTSVGIIATSLLFVLPGGRRWFKGSYVFYPYYPVHLWFLSCWAKGLWFVPYFPIWLWAWGGVYFMTYLRQKFLLSKQA